MCSSGILLCTDVGDTVQKTDMFFFLTSHTAKSDAMSHDIWETLNWKKFVYEDCITYQNRIVVDTSCISEESCLEHGWLLEGPACNIHSVTHSVPDVFFLCCFLYIGTFVIAIFFRTFRGSNYFPTIVSYST